MTSSLRGRVCVVTGASGGIGQAAAQALAALGAHVVLACRSETRGRAALDAIGAAVPAASLDLRLVDLSIAESVRDFARAMASAYPALHVLVNNAGGWSDKRVVTKDGLEQTWATNVLGYFLTTHGLLDRLRAGAPARIVNVASELAGGLDLADVGFARRPYDGVAAYSQSKQANRMFTWALARRLAGSGVAANAMHPGGVRTGIFRKGGGLRGWLGAVATGLVGRTPVQGADTVVWLAASPEVEGRSGGFYVDRRERPCRFRNEAAEERLFALCEEMTGARYVLSAR
jgi:NAD(P)-dependent dehydrogenase (short-subunit alcohol dehydrogenase family)